MGFSGAVFQLALYTWLIVNLLGYMNAGPYWVPFFALTSFWLAGVSLLLELLELLFLPIRILGAILDL